MSRGPLERRQAIIGWLLFVILPSALLTLGLMIWLHPHLTVHYLDLARHEAISSTAWEPIKTNIGANLWWIPVAAIATMLLIPRVRAWLEERFRSLHAKLDAHQKAQRSLLEQHRSALMAQSERQHQERLDQEERHHQERLIQQAKHHKAMLQVVRKSGPAQPSK